MAQPEDPVIYRTEVLAIIGALSGLVVETREIRKLLEDDDGQEGEQEEADA